MKLKLVSADKGCEIVVSGVINVLIMCELARRCIVIVIVTLCLSVACHYAVKIGSDAAGGKFAS